MEIIPIRQEYVFSAMTHTMRAVVDHIDKERHLSYFFDEKMVAEKIIEGGSYYTDDECIAAAVEDYRKHKVNSYSDLVKNHLAKITLASKMLEVNILVYGIVINAKIRVIEGYYEIELNTENGDDSISGRFKAADFPEVLEKTRVFTNILGDVSNLLAEKIDILSNDRIKKAIRWQE